MLSQVPRTQALSLDPMFAGSPNMLLKVFLSWGITCGTRTTAPFSDNRLCPGQLVMGNLFPALLSDDRCFTVHMEYGSGNAVVVNSLTGLLRPNSCGLSTAMRRRLKVEG